MRPKRLISLLVAVCMMITMLPLSAVTAFAADTPSSTEQEISVGDYKYAYTVNAGGSTATITEFRGPVDPAKTPAPYDITIPTELNGLTVTGLGENSFSTDDFDSPLYDIHHTKIHSVTIPQCVTSIGEAAFAQCRALQSLTIDDAAISIGDWAFDECLKLTTLSLGKKITTIGDYAFDDCRILNNVTIPQSVTSIGKQAFGRCYGMDSFTIEDAATSIGEYAFWDCQKLETLSLGKNITTIGDDAFRSCYKLETIMLPAGLTSFGNCLIGCPAGRKWDYHGNPINPIGAIYYNNDWDHAKELPGYNVLKNRNFLYLCKVTFDANGGTLTDSAEVPVYKTEKITDTKANELTAINDPTRAGYKFTGWYTTADGKPEDGKFDVDETAITEDITLHAGWEFDPNAPGCHPLTVTGGTVTVKYDGSDVTSKLNSKTDAATGQKTYSVPDGAEVTVTLDKTAVPNGKVFDGWSTSLPTGQNYKTESITFTMNSDVNVSAKYRDAATDHTPNAPVCHPLTVTGGIVTVKNGDKDVTDTLTVTTDETTGKKTYDVPDGAEVTVTLDKDKIPEGMVFDIWSTGKFSLPLGQDYKAETITFTMSSDVDIAAQYRDATIEDDGPGVLGTVAIIGTAAVGGAVLGYQAYSLGAEFAGKLMALPYFPSNRSALAMMLWEDAGKPMPESELLYPDVGQEERDMDLQHAARWAMENDLVPDLNDEGTAPEEMKFYPDNTVSKIDVLKAWQKAQELKQNA